MGYRAPSAEDVYRYVFRLDSYSRRSLTDGFGLSIIFVNDNSSVCRDFISRYFVDICHRTADRIRIIFFSEIPESYFEYIAQQMNSNSYSAERLRENGLLHQVIQETSHRYRDRRGELLDDFLEALRWQDYNQVDWLLASISRIFGPRYADALYRLVREHQYGDARNVELRTQELILELQDPERRLRRDRFYRIYEARWRELTPDAFTLIDAPERTRELSYDTKMNTAMPGVGESMRFAARLGIGRYVPCFVFFTDVGQLSVDVFPVGELSAEETYKQVRAWIDSFYEENCVLVDKWKQLEKDITVFKNFVNKPLTELQNWISKSEQLWDELRTTAQIIIKLRASISNSEAHKSVIDGINTNSWRCRKILSDYQTRLENLYTERNKHRIHQRHLKLIINKIMVASDYTKIYDQLYLAVYEPLTPTELSILRSSIELIEQHRQKLNISLIEMQLFTWWRLVQENLPSFKKYKYNRPKWKFALQRYNQGIRDEYAAFLKAVFELPFSDTPEILLEKTRSLLANIIGIDTHLSEWGRAFSKYTKQLMSFFRNLHDNAPEWIVRDEATLKISDIIPFQNRHTVDFRKILAAAKEDAPLRCIIQKKVAAKQMNRQPEVTSEIEKVALQCRDEVSAALTKLLKEELDLSKEESAAYSDCLRGICDIRNKIEKELVDLANSVYNPGNSPHFIGTKDIESFLTLLDEYDCTVNNLIYPYKRDRKVQNINLPEPFPKIFELKIPDRSNQRHKELKDTLEQLKDTLEETVHSSKSGGMLLQEIQKRSSTITPTARLASELVAITEKAELPRNNVERSDLVVLENLEEKLYGLNDDELTILSNSIAKLNLKAGSREEIIDVILAIVGLIPARELAIHRQYANRPINVEVKTVTEQSKRVEVEMNFHAPVTGATGKNDGVININISEQKQTLAEAAAEIQQLLRQLEKTNPSATEAEQVAYVDVAVQSSLKQRTIAALKAGGETAIDEFFLENKYLKVGKAVVKAWLQPSS